MSPLDAARQLDNAWIPISTRRDGTMVCKCCDAVITSDPANRAHGHHPACPWLSLPRIVTALEAAELIVRRSSGRVWNESETSLSEEVAALVRTMRGPRETEA